MSLASPTFVFLFLAPVVALNALLSRWWPEGSVPLLLSATVAFCLLVEPLALPLLAASTVVNYVLTGWIKEAAESPRRRRRLVVAGVLVNVVPLVWFKFHLVGLPGTGTFASASSAAVMTAGIPLGLAFYSLHQITGIFDIQRPGAVRLPPARHALMVGLFSQLPAGPIARYRDVAPQYQRLGREPLALESLLRGGSLVLFGLTKKALLADPLGAVVNAIHAGAATQAVNPLEAWYAAWGFLLQLYLDFSAYSDIAIGIGMCVGVRLPVNFDSPLKASSVADYVNRWHVSLIEFTREYVFTPAFARLRRLPGVSAERRNLLAWAVATLLAYAVIGAWHAPTLTILVYSLLVGGVVVAAQVPSVFRSWRPATGGARWRGPLARVGRRLTLLLVASLAALLFRAETPAALRHLLGGLVDIRSILGPLRVSKEAGLSGAFGPGGFMPLVDARTTWSLVSLGVATFAVLWLPNTMEVFGIGREARPGGRTTLTWRATPVWGVLVGLLAVLWIVAWVSGDLGTTFVYERF